MAATEHTALLEPAPTTWIVERDGREIARSDQAVLLHETYGDKTMAPVAYFPIQAVTGARLEATDHHTACPIKGEASYFRVEIDNPDEAQPEVLDNAVWTYPTPLADLADIAGHVAFYPDRFEVRPAVRRTPEELMTAYLSDIAMDGKIDLIDEITQPYMVDVGNRFFGGPAGRAGLRSHVIVFRRQIADLDVTIDRIVAGPDTVMARWTCTGVLAESWLNQPVGRPVKATVFSFFDLVDGRVSRYHVWLDSVVDGVHTVFDTTNPDPALLPR